MQKVIVFNHPSWVDSILLLYLFAPSGVSREANLHIPVVGRIIWSFQNIYVPSKKTIEQATQAAQEGSSVQQPLVPAKSTVEQMSDRHAACPLFACCGKRWVSGNRLQCIDWSKYVSATSGCGLGMWQRLQRNSVFGHPG